jgi:hypothetical protein
MIIVRENHQNGRKFTIATESCCCLHRRHISFCNLRFHKVLALKIIPTERVDARTCKNALVFAGK